MQRPSVFRSLLLLAAFLSCTAIAVAFDDSDLPPPSPTSYAPPPADAAADPIAESPLQLHWGDSKAAAYAPLQLTSQNLFDALLESRQAWIVSFVAPWCGHCRSLHPEFERGAQQLAGAVRFGTVDCTVEKSLASQFNIAGFPTILVFPAGKKTPKSIVKYQGQRQGEMLASYARGLLSSRAIRLLQSSHDQFPRNVLAFFSATHVTPPAASQHSLLVFLHTAKAGDALRGLSQLLEGRVRVAVVEPQDQELQRMFRVRCTPTYLACVPALQTRANETGTVECSVYASASRQGGGLGTGAGATGVRPVSEFLQEFMRATASGLHTEQQAKYRLQRYVIDAQKAAADDAAQMEKGAALAGSSSSALPALLSSAARFRSECIDTPLGACLLLLSDLQSASSRSAARHVAHGVASWNAANPARRGMQLSLLLAAASSPFAVALVESLHVYVGGGDDSMTLLALLPRRNRLSHFGGGASSSFDPHGAVEWAERIVRGDSDRQLDKQKDMESRLRSLLQGDEQILFAPTLAPQPAPPAAADSSSDVPHAGRDEL